jgi:hypothetical protein
VVEKREDGWWFRDPYNSDPYYQDVGPYETKKDAEAGKRGLYDFWKNLSGLSDKERKRRKDDVPKVSAPSELLQPDGRAGEGSAGGDELPLMWSDLRQGLLFT